jgi:hypothetical protein
MSYGSNRELATIIHGYLGTHRKVFIDLFPQYQPYYEKLDKIQQDLVREIIAYNKSNGTSAVANSNSAELANLNSVDADPVEYLTKLIQKKLTLNAENDEESGKHILGIINNVKFTNLYIGLFNKA